MYQKMQILLGHGKEEIPKKEHSYLLAMEEATCNSEGKIVRYCVYDGCNDITTVEVLEKEPHTMIVNDIGTTKSI